MTQREILRYAIQGAMIQWDKEWKHYTDHPTNDIAMERFRRIDRKVDELKEMLMQETTKAE